MGTKSRLAAILIALTVFGCKGPVQTSAASTGDGGGAATAEVASGPTASSGTHNVYITDPSLNDMNAFEVTIPGKWHFQGVLYQGGNCTSVPYGVYRATSPDGLSYVERMPALSWVWGTGPQIGFMPKNDCLPMNGPMSAQDFLKYMAATMKVEYVGVAPVPAEENAKAQKALQDAEAVYAPKYAAMHAQPPRSTRELARADVRYKNGTFEMKGRLNVMVECMETTYAGMPGLTPYTPGHPPQMTRGQGSTVDKCTANVTYFTAPENQFASLIRLWDAPGMGVRSEHTWEEAWIQRNNQQSQQMMAQMSQAAAQQRQASAQAFQHDQAVRQEMHEQFMSTMRAGTDASLARTQASMNARSTSTSDWVDFALDRQTVRDPNTGQVSKVSSSYSRTWIDSTGKTSYQTNDPNANPNGVLPGNWTQQNVTHGDGTSY
jgi:hypothetical protein